jgi:protein-S-isoprenylcysteine O-methyltransferase Ste14
MILAYGVVAYLIFLGSLLYAIGFVGGVVVPKTIDSGPALGIGVAIVIDLALLSLFAVQHSVMARPAFKRWWTQVTPPAMERSTYVLASSLMLIVLFWLWQPLPNVVWDVTHPWVVGAFWVVFIAGWVVVVVSTFLIDHFDLFGLRQVVLNFTGEPYTPPSFRTPWLYRLVRHPIMLGFLIAFWATPMMTQGHLLFAAGVSAYVLIAIQLEERDLTAHYGETYSAYQREVSMLVPLPKREQPASEM